MRGKRGRSGKAWGKQFGVGAGVKQLAGRRTGWARQHREEQGEEACRGSSQESKGERISVARVVSGGEVAMQRSEAENVGRADRKHNVQHTLR